MGWLDRWIWEWGGRWLGGVSDQDQPPQPTTTKRRFGRILRPRSDQLFAHGGGDLACAVSAGAVVLLRRENSDDYVRMHVPDTNCPRPPLPDEPLDSGAADWAEPNRWSFWGKLDYSGSGWVFGPEHTSALNMVRPSYTCYLGDFLTRVSVRIYANPSLLNQYRCDHFGLFLIQDGVPTVGIGFGSWLHPDPDAVGHWVHPERYVNGSWILSYANLPGPYLDNLAHLFIRRSGTTVSVGWSWEPDPSAPLYGTEVEVASGISGPVLLAVAKDYNFPNAPPGFPSARLVAGMLQWKTIYGAPSEIWVETPVVDMGAAQQVVVRGLPNGTQLVWRAGNELPLPNYWDNPTGAYRYWQAKLSTSSPNLLLERIEFVSDAEPLTLWRRFRSYWQLFETGAGRITKGPFRTVFGSGGQQRTQDGWIQQSDEERNVGDW